MPYLSTHFREKITPDGEQVYFAVSKDGLKWEPLNGGKPVLTSNLGAKGVRDIEIIRKKEGGFVILATDLCIVYRMDENYCVDWKDINHNGSKMLSFWETDDLINFSEQKLLFFGRDDFGCLWAPEIYFDEENGEYVIHWGSTVAENGFEHMSVYYTKTKDFKEFTLPELYFTKDNEILDSHIVKIGDTYHLFYKNSNNPPMNMHETSKSLFGPFEHDEKFDAIMDKLGNPGAYEAATTYILPDGRWCLMLDFFGCEKEKMGYVPFISAKPGDADFVRADEEFSFPYGFKHGRFIEITDEEYTRLINHYGN
ncbi:MAG: glycoside hydrolase family 43 protein [Clostridia bacterium]|nr:glycoside hydrolase family 43 protein [Clostridia bacterium]